MKYLRAFHTKDSYTKDIKKAIFQSIYTTVFTPVLTVIKENLPIRNNYDVVKTAILTGKIQYQNGKFYGSWNAKLSKAMRDMGAVYVHKDSTFRLAHLPMDIEMAIGSAQSIYQNIVSGIGSIDFELNPIPKVAYLKTAEKIKKDFKASLLGLLLIIPKDIYTEPYIYELNMAVEKFSQNEIDKLLTFVNSSNGNLTNIYNYIEERINVAKRKSEFLSYNTTNRMLENYKQEEYKTYGITQYIWRTKGDDKVRPRHRELDGQIIDYDNPPIVDFETGRTAHASEDYNCRCHQQPILTRG